MWHKPFFLYTPLNKGLERVGIADTIANLVVCLRQMMDTHHLPPRRDSEAEQVPSTALFDIVNIAYLLFGKVVVKLLYIINVRSL